jgi:cytochrome c oxidase cbb3-type subunit III
VIDVRWALPSPFTGGRRIRFQRPFGCELHPIPIINVAGLGEDRVNIGRLIRILAFLTLPVALVAQPQAPAGAPPETEQTQVPGGRGGTQGRGGGQRGANFPQQQRRLAEPAVLAKGKGLYESNCAACHGIDLRGGQQGGPNLLRSQTLLSDKSGELIAPIVTGGRPNPAAGAPPMPAFQFLPDDLKAIAEYLHSVLAQAGAQGRPPVGEVVPPEKVLVGDKAAGQTFFATQCSSCHSVTGDLRGIASRAPDPRELQNLWITGGGGGGRGGRAGGAPLRPVTVTVTPASGARVEGRLVRIDDFLVTLIQGDGTRRTIVRNGAEPKIELKDPAEAHRKLVPTLADKDMHNVTAYLWTIK